MVAGSSAYRQDILDDARNPKHFGAMRDPEVVLEAANPTCGDEITLYLKFRDANAASSGPRPAGARVNRIIDDATFTGRGCMVMIASASRFTEAIRGKSAAEVRAMGARDALAIFGAPLTPSRQPCALMPWQALQSLWVGKRGPRSRQR